MLKYESPLKELPKNWLQCIGNNNDHCTNRFESKEIIYNCTCSTGELLEVKIDLDALRAVSPEEWRKILTERAQQTYRVGGRNLGVFQEFLPINDSDSIVSLNEGWTPINEADKIAKDIGLQAVYLKMLGANPSGSFKDNGMAMLATQANWLYREGYLQKKILACASTGNTSSSLADYAAKMGAECYVFVGGNVSPAKLAQTELEGAKVIEIDGDFDDAMRMVENLSKKGYFYLANSVNPYRIEGQKTILMESIIQMGFDAENLDIVLPVGNGGNLSALKKAIEEWLELGIIDVKPRIYGVQAEGASPLARKFETGYYRSVKAETCATAIRIGDPVRGETAERGAKWTGGKIISVSDEEIFKYHDLLAKSGYGCEPASAASVAGLRQLVDSGDIDSDGRVLCLLTGHLLKDTENPIRWKKAKGQMPERKKVSADEEKILKILNAY